MSDNINRKHIWECKKLMHNIENFSEIRKKEVTNRTLGNPIKFNEILCPITKGGIIVSNCSTCQYCQKMKGMHPSGRSLISLICLYNSNNKGEVQ